MPNSTRNDLPAACMTDLDAVRRVSKADVAIELRGQLDTLDAHLLFCLAQAVGQPALEAALREMRTLAHDVMVATCTGAPLADWNLMGLSPDALRKHSHTLYAQGDPQPHLKLQDLELYARVNLARTIARQCERAAVASCPRREDVLTALNRLSSALHICQCRIAVGEVGAGQSTI